MAYRILILTTILLLNGFFAAAEVSLVSVRQSKLKSLAEQGNAAAAAALSLLANPARLLSVTQVGVTLASLGLGWAGEGTIYEIIVGLAPALTGRAAIFVHGIALTVAFLLISYAHVVIGEVVPKNLALEKADRLALLVAPALLIFERISAPFVMVSERSAAAISRLIGLKGQHGGGHSAEELKFIVSSSRSEGHLKRFEEDSIQRLLDLQNYSAREIMVPRRAIVSVPVDANLETVLRVMREHQFSRLPVYENSPETIIGYVHYKDLMELWAERRAALERRKLPRSFRLKSILRTVPVVPETKPLHDLIDEFRATHKHLAIVVDEFGTIVGLVTLEDVLEQIFGEIGDEHDAQRPVAEAQADVLDVEGSTSIRDLATQYGLGLPGDAGFETLAGFLMYQFGYIPKQNESFEYGGRKFTILEMDRHRIVQVRIERLKQVAT
ncbi:MAG: hemolysin family protein [Acidobacteriota bacterium]|nr:hemolysin family protein [Acidobacteriota bacterium]